MTFRDDLLVRQQSVADLLTVPILTLADWAGGRDRLTTPDVGRRCGVGTVVGSAPTWSLPTGCALRLERTPSLLQSPVLHLAEQVLLRSTRRSAPLHLAARLLRPRKRR